MENRFVGKAGKEMSELWEIRQKMLGTSECRKGYAVV